MSPPTVRGQTLNNPRHEIALGMGRPLTDLAPVSRSGMIAAMAVTHADRITSAEGALVGVRVAG